MSEPVTIYALCDDSGVRYVGQTRVTLAARLAAHVASRNTDDSARNRWLRATCLEGRTPRIMLLETVAMEQADETERRQIAMHRARGCRLVNGRPGGIRRRTGPDLDWSCAIRLTAERAEKLERIARREELPVATMARRLLSERLDQIGDE